MHSKRDTNEGRENEREEKREGRRERGSLQRLLKGCSAEGLLRPLNGWLRGRREKARKRRETKTWREREGIGREPPKAHQGHWRAPLLTSPDIVKNKLR